MMIRALCVLLILFSKVSLSAEEYSYIERLHHVDGSVNKLQYTCPESNVLVALVGSDSKTRKPINKGLYFYDVSEVISPRLLSILSLEKVKDFDIEPDGKYLYAYTSINQDSQTNDLSGVIVIDIEEPKIPTVVGNLELDVFSARLGHAGKYLYISERKLGNNKSDNLFDIYKIDDNGMPQHISGVGGGNHSAAYEIYPHKSGNILLLYDGYDYVTSIYDISDKSDVRVIREGKLVYGTPRFFEANNKLYGKIYDELYVIDTKNVKRSKKVTNSYERLDDFHYADDLSVYLSSRKKKVYRLMIGNNNDVVSKKSFVVPDYIKSVIPAKDDVHVYVGINNNIAVINTSDRDVSGKELMKAHARALSAYRDNSSIFESDSINNAINIMESSGVEYAMKKYPDDISKKTLAAILNDYGFFLAKGGEHHRAVSVYEHVIALHPRRSVVYLNIGDSLFELLSEVSADKRNELTQQVNGYYLKYKELSGSGNERVDMFLSENMEEKDYSTVCDYIESYRDKGRIQEVFGSGLNILRSDGKRRMDVMIEYLGTAHMPVVSYSDSETDELISYVDEPFPGNAGPERWASKISVVPFSDNHYLLFSEGDSHLISAHPIGFSTTTTSGCLFK